MNKLYNKSELGFAIFWIVLYIVLASLGDSISATIGIEKSITSVVLIAMSLIILLWIIKSKHTDKYGLCLPKHNPKYYLYYIPLIVMISMNMWLGVQLNYTILESILYIVSMLCVGFLEEIIFRGFLFKALEKVYLNSSIELKDYAKLLYNQALLIEGFELEDPVAFSKQMCDLMVKAIK